jgi:hypothetical protein
MRTKKGERTDPRKIFITAEDSGDVQSPGSQLVLTTP